MSARKESHKGQTKKKGLSGSAGNPKKAAAGIPSNLDDVPTLQFFDRVEDIPEAKTDAEDQKQVEYGEKAGAEKMAVNREVKQQKSPGVQNASPKSPATKPKKKGQKSSQTKKGLELNRDAEILLTTEPGFLEAENGEDTSKITQDDIVEEIGVRDRPKRFDISLDHGPYRIDYTRNGKFLAFAGSRGHIALVDWATAKPVAEYDVEDTTHDIKFLMNFSLHAVAQSKYTYIYNSKGVEIHCLKQHIQPRQLEYLPFHMLLCSSTEKSRLVYQDVSTGEIVTKIRTKLGPSSALVQNPYNALLCMGHGNGVVSMWTPNSDNPAVKLQAHRGPISAIAVDNQGMNMVTASHDGTMKVWDIRAFKPVYTQIMGVSLKNIAISQKGLIATGFNNSIRILKDAFLELQKKPYMTHKLERADVCDMSYVPFEDVLGIGHSKGVSSILVPGSGEPNFDSFEANPFQTKKQMREDEVHKLLDKLRPDMISLDPRTIGSVNHSEDRRKEKMGIMEQTGATELKKKQRNKMKGRNSIKNQLGKKKAVIIDKEKAMKREQMKKKAEMKEKKTGKGESHTTELAVPVLKRFKRSSN